MSTDRQPQQILKDFHLLPNFNICSSLDDPDVFFFTDSPYLIRCSGKYELNTLVGQYRVEIVDNCMRLFVNYRGKNIISIECQAEGDEYTIIFVNKQPLYMVHINGEQSNVYIVDKQIEEPIIAEKYIKWVNEIIKNKGVPVNEFSGDNLEIATTETINVKYVDDNGELQERNYKRQNVSENNTFYEVHEQEEVPEQQEPEQQEPSSCIIG